MALTTAQKTKVEKIKEHVAKMRSTLDESTSLRAMFGNYIFEELQQLDKELKELEQA